MEQKHPSDLFEDALTYLWDKLALSEKGWKRLKRGAFKKKAKNRLTCQIGFEHSRYNDLVFESGHGDVEVGFHHVI